ncbi:MAG: hypothetical protein LBH59_01105 [Planctomycetaceae bacterium]|nr:hypothetical protein [Planctomycetaceae bacterium]
MKEVQQDNMPNQFQRGERVRGGYRQPNNTNNTNNATQRPPFPRINRQGNINAAGNNGIEVNVPSRNNEQDERNIQRLRNFDTNKNGILEQNEMSDPQRRENINQIVTRLGGNPNQPTININELARRVSSSNRGAGTPPLPDLPSDPLVPYFGENEKPLNTTLQFGERTPTQNNKTNTNQTQQNQNNNNNKITQARTILTQFDSNHNGTLDKDKGEWNGVTVDTNKADTNKDGRISMDELVAVLGGSSNSAVPALVKVKPSIPYEHLPTGMPDWFFERDVDQDAQLTMLEYAKGAELNDAIATEFLFLDKNNDGFATVDEIFKTLKQVDEEKQKQADLERREKELKLGNTNAKNINNPPTPSPTNNTPTTGNITVINNNNVVNAQPNNQPIPTFQPKLGTPVVVHATSNNGTENQPHIQAMPETLPTGSQGGVIFNSPPPATTNTPSWQPGSPTVTPTETPPNAPYSIGSPNTNNSIRNNGRNNRTWNRETWNRGERNRNNNERRNEQRRER